MLKIGGRTMLYKRTEYFRHTFSMPLDAKIRILMSDGKESGVGNCQLIDLSPGGAKLLSSFNIPFQRDAVRMHLEFTLYQMKVDVYGFVVWKENDGASFMYGFDFDENAQTEELIVNELKLYRKQEVEKKKYK